MVGVMVERYSINNPSFPKIIKKTQPTFVNSSFWYKKKKKKLYKKIIEKQQITILFPMFLSFKIKIYQILASMKWLLIFIYI